MSTLEDSVSEPIEERPSVSELPEKNMEPTVSEPSEKNREPAVKSKKSTLKSYRQKAQALQARIKYREKAIKGIRQHLKRGTFPKRFKSLRPYPKMDSLEAQAVVNAACQQVDCVILDQMMVDEENKLRHDRASYEALKKERECERSQLVRKPPKRSVAQLRQELADLQTKYALLCQQLNSTQ